VMSSTPGASRYNPASTAVMLRGQWYATSVKNVLERPIARKASQAGER